MPILVTLAELAIAAGLVIVFATQVVWPLARPFIVAANARSRQQNIVKDLERQIAQEEVLEKADVLREKLRRVRDARSQRLNEEIDELLAEKQPTDEPPQVPIRDVAEQVQSSAPVKARDPLKN